MPAKVDRLRRNVSCTEAKLRAFSTRAHVFTQIHGCSSRHNATTGLASYEHFLRTQAQRIRLWTPQLQQYCGSRSLKCAYRGERPSSPPFPSPFSTSVATAPLSQPQPAMHRHPFTLLTFFRLCTSPFKRRDCSLHILWDQPPTHPTNQPDQPAIHLSIHDGSVCPSTAIHLTLHFSQQRQDLSLDNLLATFTHKSL